MENSPHILVADDDLEIRTPLGHYLQSQDCRVSFAEDARSAEANVRVYYRVLGKPKTRLPAQIGTLAFLAESRAAAAGKTSKHHRKVSMTRGQRFLA